MICQLGNHSMRSCDILQDAQFRNVLGAACVQARYAVTFSRLKIERKAKRDKERQREKRVDTEYLVGKTLYHAQFSTNKDEISWKMISEHS